ncbi:hypothetical protein I3A86_24570, partial [Salmonella enterica]|nr:hypothetical protein [Salmonella enterica]
YRFHVHDEQGLLDEEGIDLPDLAAAKMEAVRLAGGMLLDDASLVHSSAVWHVSVADPDGSPLFQVDVMMTNLTRLH